MISLTNLKKEAGHQKGFTLLELLIVIAIIAILSIALVFMLNPAETLKKARDAQRISDLKSVKTALGIMLTASSTPSLDNFGTVCLSPTNLTGKVAYSAFPIPTAGITTVAGGDATAGGAFSATVSYGAANATSTGKVDGTGWIPVNLKALTGGTPIASYPVDPVNTVTVGGPTSADLAYRYACQNGSSAGKPSYVFEIDAILESNAYTVEDNKMSKDGGDNVNYYETGNSLNLLPITTTF